MFNKYQHIERFGTTEVDGIEIGTCFVFPKIDGTNGSVWLGENGEVKAGSRNRELSLENDNAGFCAYVLDSLKIEEYLKKHPQHRLFGEWLVPHTLKTYRDEAWRKFYVFDACLDKEDGTLEYLPYEIYQPMLEEFGIDYIPPIKKMTNANYENFIHEMEANNFLIQDGKGAGEGIVIKNYDFYNRYKRQIWAKIVASEFKERHIKTMGCPEATYADNTEQKIAQKYCTTAFIEKEYSKIVAENDGWSSKYIPMLLGRVFSELIKEEMWHILKEFKNPKIDFKMLNAMVINQIKATKPMIFS